MGDSSKLGGLIPRPRLTYANVMATLAFFIALGGSSYAALQISGSQIRNRSIPGNKLRLHAVDAKDLNVHGVVVPRAQFSETTADLLVPAPRSRQRRAVTAQTRPACATGSLVSLSVGQSCVMFTKSPFTLTASCTDAGGGNYKGEVSATSTENGWYAFPPGTSYPAGTVTILSWEAPVPNSEVIGGPGPLITAPDGTALSFTYVRMFIHEPFADCGIATNAIG